MEWTCTNCDHTNKQTDRRCSKCLRSKYAPNTLNVLADQSGPPLTSAVAVQNGLAEVHRVGATEVPSLPLAAVYPAELISEKTAQGDVGAGLNGGGGGGGTGMLQAEGQEVELPTALPAAKTKYGTGDHHYWTSMLLNASTIVALVLSVQLLIANASALQFFVSCGLFIFFYVLYLWHGIFMASDLEYLTNCVDASDYFKTLARQRPTLIMSIQCYHYALPCVKVFTFRASRLIKFTRWHDQSDLPTELDDKSAVKISVINRTVQYADEYTARHIASEIEDFKNRHSFQDRHMIFTVDESLPGYQSHVLFMKKKTCCFLPGWYIFFHCLCLGWFYRRFLECQVDRATVTVSKTIEYRYSGFRLQGHVMQDIAFAGDYHKHDILRHRDIVKRCICCNWRLCALRDRLCGGCNTCNCKCISTLKSCCKVLFFICSLPFILLALLYIECCGGGESESLSLGQILCVCVCVAIPMTIIGAIVG